ncbi:MAG TPA: ATP-binding protein [Burkholderiaceae bacterium]|nr:ATP-binding protein [Burkholderiaceae bacterium]
MQEPLLTLSPAQFSAAFPFHFVLDEWMRVVQVGSVLARVCPELTLGSTLDASFAVERPSLPGMEFEAICGHPSALFILKQRHGMLRLRGQMVAQQDKLFFLGSPWVTHSSDLRELGLTLRDFAVHDPVTDLLFHLQTTYKSLADAQELSKRLRDQQDSLRAAILAAEGAQAASTAKSEFLAIMSHEIRTPLNGVLGLLDHLLTDTTLTTAQRDHVASALRSGKVLLGLINDILDFSKVEAGKLTLECVEFSPRGVVAEALDLLAGQAEQKQLQLSCDITADVPAVLCGDPGRIRQVLINYLANAIKFTPAGRVSVRAFLLDQDAAQVWLRMEVEDTGVGISEASQKRLFEHFTQADVSTTRKFKGTGLGLAISKKLARMMGGNVGLSSQPGQGSLFWFTACLKKPGADPPPDTAATQPADAAPPRPAAPSFTGRVLLAEDDAVNQQVGLLHLTAMGLTVDVVENGQAALEAAARTPYALILLDYRMPDMDGLQVCRAIRAMHLPGPRVPIIIWTASLLEVGAKVLAEAGGDGLLGKPFDPYTLRSLLSRFIVRNTGPAEAPAAHAALR